MIKEFMPVVEEIRRLTSAWKSPLLQLNESTVSGKRNSQGRTIRQIVGHMVDSASNNIHRVVHLQYGLDPLVFPNYSTDGSNDRWIAIQNFQEEDWALLVGLWELSNLHLAHVVENIDPAKVDRRWIAERTECGTVEITLREMVLGYVPHLRLHLGEIELLMT